ncbi:uncharacterized protein LOC110985742 [Acanthaster planci]|uniref:Uncharacterized protein LOC110985742 n=1 Tax=Acanthaster planci TaxID=133434 RepID=A0A8B7ZAJ3_ACAPL|nr:uncharacterized protein LOC110985742 [Acanthaster planci]
MAGRPAYALGVSLAELGKTPTEMTGVPDCQKGEDHPTFITEPTENGDTVVLFPFGEVTFPLGITVELNRENPDCIARIYLAKTSNSSQINQSPYLIEFLVTGMRVRTRKSESPATDIQTRFLVNQCQIEVTYQHKQITIRLAYNEGGLEISRLFKESPAKGVHFLGISSTGRVEWKFSLFEPPKISLDII